MKIGDKVRIKKGSETLPAKYYDRVYIILDKTNNGMFYIKATGKKAKINLRATLFVLPEELIKI